MFVTVNDSHLLTVMFINAVISYNLDYLLYLKVDLYIYVKGLQILKLIGFLTIFSKTASSLPVYFCPVLYFSLELYHQVIIYNNIFTLWNVNSESLLCSVMHSLCPEHCRWSINEHWTSRDIKLITGK
jgi:hypothetical protein